jgi:hypothetical protein
MLRIDAGGRDDALFARAMVEPDPRLRGAIAAVFDLLERNDAILPRAIEALAGDDAEVRARALDLVHGLTPARLGDGAGADADAWRAWWRRREEQERGRQSEGFRYHVEDLRRRGIDLVLVIDATGSMAPVLQATKRRIESVVGRLRRVVPNLRVRVVAYRDRDDAFVTISSPLTHDVRVLEDFLACVPASGGGDAPEGVLAGLRDATARTPWRDGTHRVVLLFGDAPPHEYETALLEATLKEFSGSVHAVDVAGYGAAPAGPPMTEFVRVAEWGRGVALRLSGEDDLLRALLVLTLGAAHRTAIETLFGL